MTEKLFNSPSKQLLLWRFVHVSLLILITSIVFSNTLDNSYHLDSLPRVQNNSEINEFWPPARFFTDVRTGSTISRIAEYRPMMPLSHAINSEIADATGTSKLAGFHVGNIAIHIGSAILVYFLFCLLISNWGRIAESEAKVIHYSHPAFAAALIFAVHPIAGSAVNYIAARDLLLMVFFFAASMLVYFSMRTRCDTVSGWLISLLLLSLAILSKQAAIMGFGLVFLFEWILLDVKLKNWRLWARTMLFAVPTAGYFLLRSLWIVPQNSADTLSAVTVKSFTYPFTMLDAHFFYYLRNFIWPFEIRALAKVETIESILAPTALIGLVFIVTTLVVAWLLRKRHPLITFAILAYWLLFSLTSSIFPFNYIVTDYRQYLPLVFLSLTLTMLVFSFGKKAFSLTFLSCLVVYFSFASYYINSHWKTEESFWGQSVKYGAMALAHSNYGLAVARKNPDLAEKHYLEALRQHPFHIFAQINLGLLYIKQGRSDEGIKILRNTARWLPNWALAHHWLSYGLKSTGEKQESIEEAQRAADLDPRSLRYQYAAGRALQDAGKPSQAIPYFERIMSLNPDYKLTGFWLGFAYQKTAQSQKAIDTYNHFLVNNPGHVQSHFNLAYALMSQEECKAAVEHFNKVLELKPGYLEAHRYLAKCYRALGNEELAIRHGAMGQSKN